MPDEANPADLLAHAARIIAAHLGNNSLPVSEVPALMRIVHKSLAEISSGAPVETILQPAVPIRRSITPDHIICLEDGKKLKMLKRHLRTAYDMSPEDYRIRWGLALDYPMVAPNYAKQRSALAKKFGLGKRRAV